MTSSPLVRGAWAAPGRAPLRTACGVGTYPRSGPLLRGVYHKVPAFDVRARLSAAYHLMAIFFRWQRTLELWCRLGAAPYVVGVAWQFLRSFSRALLSRVPRRAGSKRSPYRRGYRLVALRRVWRSALPAARYLFWRARAGAAGARTCYFLLICFMGYRRSLIRRAQLAAQRLAAHSVDFWRRLRRRGRRRARRG
jgi:hypothetical protein